MRYIRFIVVIESLVTFGDIGEGGGGQQLSIPSENGLLFSSSEEGVGNCWWSGGVRTRVVTWMGIELFQAAVSA